MPLLTVERLHFALGTRVLLDHVNLTVEAGERIALIGRNGAGKSTFLKILAGEARADDGQVRAEGGARVAYLQQDPQMDSSDSVYAVVAEGLGDLHDVLTAYHACIDRLGQGDESAMDEMARLQQQIEARGGWLVAQRLDEVITRLDLDPNVPVKSLSGGAKRRVLLAQALVQDPDVLLLDEPTNHLDIASIEWLEGLIRDFRGAVIFITHDRAFLQSLANRILELDRGQLTSWPGDYQNYLRRVEEREHAEQIQNAEFDKFLAQEEVWIRQGIKARRTRNEGRVRRLEALRKERAARVNKQGKVEVSLASAKTSGKIVVEAEHASKTFAGKPVLRDFSLRIMRGDRIGLVGPNGVGKSTLIKLMLGQIQPDSGSVRLGTQLDVAYFDQHRAQLRPDWTALENLCDGGDRIDVHGQNMHGIGYLQQFLFTPDRARTKVESLSGGERNRLLLARLFAQSANLLVLDEPTNDLDLETLEVLEQVLLDFDGTLLVVSHDRAFLDNVVTSLLVFEGDGKVREVVGTYEDWLAIRAREATQAESGQSTKGGGRAAPTKSVVSSGGAEAAEHPAKSAAKTNKLSFKEKHELAELPARIEALEAEQETLSAQVGNPDFYLRPAEETQPVLARVAALSEELEQLIDRWSDLESRAGGDA
ncbi:ABC transporter ATP-binding protein [Halothiobacillus diazotrophicus]|uniref:ATP-binding protein Uup n=1 Tax=Halothiobacillus diazotrophicus TaxID=1860122 RepID=A0A191ZJM0_9GAMM|nr:ATP-binding cassette domain-containing protein [Halothiobacillus diazotrophicus]ANJ68084.1 ABC transporter ATP-binding protein [Halothiobacillus diazotrophicus]